VQSYLKKGEELELPERALIKQRKPWYKMEVRKVPPLLFAYLGRRNSRFIKNEVGALPLTGFLCVYPLSNDAAHIHNLWQALNHPDTLENLKLVGKSYGSGAIKVEPRSLENLAIPEHVVEKFGLIGKSKTTQVSLFENAA
jgi:adenine-specific DNA-methyltransferase